MIYTLKEFATLGSWPNSFCQTCLLQLLHPCQPWIRGKLGIALLGFQHFLPEMLRYFALFFDDHPSSKANSPTWIKTSLETYQNEWTWFPSWSEKPWQHAHIVNNTRFVDLAPQKMVLTVLGSDHQGWVISFPSAIDRWRFKEDGQWTHLEYWWLQLINVIKISWNQKTKMKKTVRFIKQQTLPPTKSLTPPRPSDHGLAPWRHTEACIWSPARLHQPKCVQLGRHHHRPQLRFL